MTAPPVAAASDICCTQNNTSIGSSMIITTNSENQCLSVLGVNLLLEESNAPFPRTSSATHKNRSSLVAMVAPPVAAATGIGCTQNNTSRPTMFSDSFYKEEKGGGSVLGVTRLMQGPAPPFLRTSPTAVENRAASLLAMTVHSPVAAAVNHEY
ncbi:unnamed protein product, partial [Laminaria digitata]